MTIDLKFRGAFLFQTVKSGKIQEETKVDGLIFETPKGDDCSPPSDSFENPTHSLQRI